MDATAATSATSEHIDQPPAKKPRKKRTPEQIAAANAEKERQRAAKEAEKERLKAEKEAEKARKAAAKQAEKDAKMAAKEAAKAEKERLRAEKEAEKERQRAEKEAERAEKEAEKERVRAEKEAEKAAKEAEKAAKEAEKAAKEAEKAAKEAARAAKRRKQSQFMLSFVQKATPEKAPERPHIEEVAEFGLVEFPLDTIVATRVKKTGGDLDAAATRVEQVLTAQRVDGMVKHDFSRAPCVVGNFVTRWPHAPAHVLKLLRFEEDTRPPYYGTWSRTSNKIRARRPLGRDDELLDYDYDSDAEWVDDEQGESLSGCEDEDDVDQDGDEGEEGGFVVDDGYLSQNEGDGDEEIAGDSDALAANLKLRAKREEAKRKLVRLVPEILLPPAWPDDENVAWQELAAYRAAIHTPQRVNPCAPVHALVDEDAKEESAPKKKRCTTVPDDAAALVLSMWNGQPGAREALVIKAREVHPTLTRASLDRLLKDACVKDRRNNVRAYYVTAEYCAKYGLTEVVDLVPKKPQTTPKKPFPPMAQTSQEQNQE